MAEKKVDFSRIKTSTAAGRKNLVHLGNLMQPGRDQVAPVVNPEFDELVERIRAARNAGAPILWSIGAHVVKCGLSRYLIEFMKAGYLTHVASTARAASTILNCVTSVVPVKTSRQPSRTAPSACGRRPAAG